MTTLVRIWHAFAGVRLASIMVLLFGNRNVIVLTTLDERAIVLSNRLSWCIKKERRKKEGVKTKGEKKDAVESAK